MMINNPEDAREFRKKYLEIMSFAARKGVSPSKRMDLKLQGSDDFDFVFRDYKSTNLTPLGRTANLFLVPSVRKEYARVYANGADGEAKLVYRRLGEDRMVSSLSEDDIAADALKAFLRIDVPSSKIERARKADFDPSDYITGKDRLVMTNLIREIMEAGFDIKNLGEDSINNELAFLTGNEKQFARMEIQGVPRRYARANQKLSQGVICFLADNDSINARILFEVPDNDLRSGNFRFLDKAHEPILVSGRNRHLFTEAALESLDSRFLVKEDGPGELIWKCRKSDDYAVCDRIFENLHSQRIGLNGVTYDATRTKKYYDNKEFEVPTWKWQDPASKKDKSISISKLITRDDEGNIITEFYYVWHSDAGVDLEFAINKRSNSRATRYLFSGESRDIYSRGLVVHQAFSTIRNIVEAI